ncbi:membrane protein [Mycolicibacterium madagascariense]|uniref:Membrane protein n=1 Tax=Mycolicibacterium madagascariense TaxID=212765 RepID=A0A7I7XLR1_9MYCO|nr:gephyrin-like molybdotransferase receptor GlpR [Mycolicibacterium madagascariense]MCV7012498.1 hypothetical protein [Mycolicibacterium madagascariense]BBZ30178.1 membrane protein [Mycolicibacterium madagascariense]
MPSIPQSLLWISLVVLWLFVLVPMLVSKRETVRRTSDVALATRVLNTRSGERLLRRRKPAAGHDSDPHWRPTHDDLDDDLDEDEPVAAPAKTVVTMAPAKAQTEPDYLDVDIVEEDSGALPIGASAQVTLDRDPELPLEFDENTKAFSVDDLHEVDEPADDDHEVDARADDEMTDEFAAASDEGTDHDYEYVEDTSEFDAVPDVDLHVAGTKPHERRRTYESKTAAAVSARKFRFRKRMLMGMAVLLLISGIAAYLVSTGFWWLCGTVGAVTILYLGYLRRQTRIEEQVRRRRAQRMMRSHLGVENTNDPDYDVVPARLRRPGSVVLEIDDEDPIFEHLEYAPFARDYDLPRASGQ